MDQRLRQLRRRVESDPENNILKQRLQHLEEVLSQKFRPRIICPKVIKKDFEHCKIFIYDKEDHKATIYLGFIRHTEEGFVATPLNFKRYYKKLEKEEQGRQAIIRNEETGTYKTEYISKLIPSSSWSAKNPPDGINRSTPRFMDYISSFISKEKRVIFLSRKKAIEYLYNCYCHFFRNLEKNKFPNTIVFFKDLDPVRHCFSKVEIL